MATAANSLGEAPDSPLASRRRALGLSLVRLAVLAGYSPAYIGALEAGYVPKRSNAIERVERVLTDLETSEAAPAGGSAKTRGTARDHDEV